MYEHALGIDDVALYTKAREILIIMGEYFQIQDDYLGEKERKLKREIKGEKTEESDKRRENWREW